MNLTVVLEWLTIGQQLMEKGTSAWASVKAALAAHGIEADTTQLDAVIADAERRGARARAEASFHPASAAELGVAHGSTGE